MVKLCVGVDTVDDLREWQPRRSAERAAQGLDPRPRHVTRMWPRRADEILAGGSLFWVIRGVILARQQIDAFDEVIGEDGIRRCAIILSPKIVQVDARPRRAFQGWRYLVAADAPPDADDRVVGQPDLPVPLALALNDLGVVAR